MGGFYDSLGIRDGELRDFGSTVDINRPGSLHVHADRDWRPVGMSEMLQLDEPFALVKRVESAAGWAKGHAVTTPRSLTYRVIANVLQSQVEDKHAWDARHVRPSTAALDETSELYLPPSVIEGFPGGVELVSSRDETRTMFEPWEHIWVLLRGEAPVAIFDTEGRVATFHGTHEMMPIYKAEGHRLGSVIAATLGRTLP